jgi:nucleoside-diphosphate-sugar epimerase
MEETSTDGKVFVTGGAGHVGANLLHRLLADGWSVRALLRPGDNNEAVDAVERKTGRKVERVLGDLRDLGLLRQRMEGCERAFHVAAKVSTISGSSADLRDLYECNVIGTGNLLSAARDVRMKRVVVTGSFSAIGYDESDPSKPSNESMPFRPFDGHMPYGRTKMLVEHECLKAVALGQDVVIATSCAVLGPWDHIPSRMGRTLVDFANGRLRAYVPGGFEFVAAKDLVEGHVLAMKRGRAGQRYIFSTQFLTVDEIMEIFERVSGRSRPKLRLPPPVMAGVAEVTSFVLTTFFPKVPQRFTPGAVRILRMQRHADITKAKTELGYAPTSIHAAVDEAYADFACRGLVPPPARLTRGNGVTKESPAADEALTTQNGSGVSGQVGVSAGEARSNTDEKGLFA